MRDLLPMVMRAGFCCGPDCVHQKCCGLDPTLNLGAAGSQTLAGWLEREGNHECGANNDEMSLPPTPPKKIYDGNGPREKDGVGPSKMRGLGSS